MDDEKKDHILSAALELFFRYGYRRVSMEEIAQAADMSRQGLYLYFRTKKDVYIAAVQRRAEILLAEIHEGMTGEMTVEEKLMYAFELWTIRDYDAEIGSPEAREIYAYTQPFMAASFDTTRRRFEAVVTATLVDHFAGKDSRPPFEEQTIAHLIYSSMRGLKLSASSAHELRGMIQNLLRLIIGTSGR